MDISERMRGSRVTVAGHAGGIFGLLSVVCLLGEGRLEGWLKLNPCDREEGVVA